MWVIPSLILLVGVANMVAGASRPPAPVFLAFAPDQNSSAARQAAKTPIVKAMNKAALQHETPGGRPTRSPPVDKPPLLRPSLETAPM
jgi:hypothetical protein